MIARHPSSPRTNMLAKPYRFSCRECRSAGYMRSPSKRWSFVALQYVAAPMRYALGCPSNGIIFFKSSALCPSGHVPALNLGNSEPKCYTGSPLPINPCIFRKLYKGSDFLVGVWDGVGLACTPCSAMSPKQHSPSVLCRPASTLCPQILLRTAFFSSRSLLKG